jgi:DNA adenine methylase
MQPATLSPDLPVGSPLKPPLKWAGGKRWLVPLLWEFWQQHRHRRLVEPCVGGMAVALGLQPSRALLNDANPHLVNFFCWLQRGLMIQVPLANDPDCYYQHRQSFNDLVKAGQTESAEAAQLFYYLNRTGFNGLCRFNRSNEFNVPFGRYKTINYIRDFRDYQPLLTRWQFQTGDFRNLDLEPEDFIYADPPYDVTFTQYSAQEFGWAEQVRLAEWLAAHPGPVILSNQATERIVELYTNLDFKLHIVHAPRRIACNGDRTPAREVIASRGCRLHLPQL